MKGEYSPVPRELPEVPAAERAAVANLVEAAEQAVSAARFHEGKRDGTYFVYQADEIELTDGAEPTSLAMWRTLEDFINPYRVAYGDVEAEVFFTPDGVFGKDHVDVIQRTGKAVRNGEVTGIHTASATKWLQETENDENFVALEVEVTRANDGRLMPTTAVELRLYRPYDDGNARMQQTRRIESDPNTGELRMTDNLENEHILALGTGLVREQNQFSNPMPEWTGAELQARYCPPTPVDHTLDSTAWNGLLTQPLDPRDKLQN